MTAIKKLTDGSGSQYFPQTHTNAVVDDNGYSVESRMQAVQDVVNQAQMEIGAVPNDLTPTNGSTNWVTSGGVYNAIMTESPVTLPSVMTLAIKNNGQFTSVSGVHHYQVPVIAGATYKILQNATANTRIWWCKSATPSPVAGNYVPFCDGETQYHAGGIGEYVTYTAPADANYMYLDGGNNAPQGAWQFVNAKDEVAEIKDRLDTVEESVNDAVPKIEKLDNYTIGGLIEPLMENGHGVNANTGKLESESNLAVSDFYPICGAKYIRVTKALSGSSKFGLAFYSYSAQATYISGVVFSEYDAEQSYEIVDIAVPEGAEWIKLTAYASTHARHFTPWFKLIYGANELFKDAVNAQMATHIMRSCKSISQGVLANDATTNYAFSANMYILGSYAYVTYAAGNTLNGDSPSPTDQVKGLQAKISLETNEVVETLTSTVAGLKDENGDDVTGYKPTCNVPVKNGNNQVAMVGQLVISGSKDPIISTTGFGTPEYISNPTYQMCRLQYEAGGTSYDVRFSIANYRQMLVDLGYVSTYSAPVYDGFDNNCIIYDAANNKFYDLICTVSSSNLNLPLMLLESTDTYTWTVKARIGTDLWKANEIKGVCKDGKIYATIRQMASEDALSWLVYDVDNNTVVSNGTFHTGVTVSRPYTFIFNDDIYMVVNVNPSVYGTVLNGNSNGTDTRTEVNIYEVVNDVPVFVRKVNNPTGINYHCWEQIPPHTVSGKSAHMTGYGAVYCAFSEDRRLLYNRMFSQVSFGDVTPLFVKLRYNYLLL